MPVLNPIRRFAPALLTTVLALASAALAAAAPVAAAPGAAVNPLAVQGPVAPEFAVMAAGAVPGFGALPVDRVAAMAEDLARAAADEPPRFALPQAVDLTPENAGAWEDLDGRFVMWRLRLTSPGALSLNLGFTAYRLPKGGRLSLYPTDVAGFDDPRGVRVFTDLDNEDHGQLWTPVVVSDDIMVELVLPAESRHDYDLTLGSVNRGYRFFGESLEQMRQDKAGSCNVDVVCPEGDDWRLEINAVGVISTGGSTFCTGSMLNNTAVDGAPYFLTANHCAINTGNAASLVVYWNFQSPVCGAQSGGSLLEFQTGSVFLAAGATSDFTLVLLDDPVNPAHEVSFAGWNRSTANPTSATAIHHPNTDEKSISFEYQAPTTTSYYGNASPGDGSHMRIADWDVGTTEPGSSGSPLFDQNHRVVGQLHGGDAACGNDLSDWYGRFSTSWSSMATWLDPFGSAAAVLDTYAPWAAGLSVIGGSYLAEGNPGSPFTPASQDYVVTNIGVAPVNYTVSDDVAWTDIANAVGTIGAGAQVTVTVSLNAVATAQPFGIHEGTLTFTNTTDGKGNATRALRLTVGVPVPTLAFPLDTDPGWTKGTGWGFGVPAGGGGQYGNNDPTSGYTGANVLGYNLAGDYPYSMAESHLTTTAIDCSAMSGTVLKFRRWLNVEQPLYDHAWLRVSTNGGASWTNVWTNATEITDAAWNLVSYDISALADGMPSVLVRWTMGTTDSNWQYSGWNIDDVELWAMPAYVSGVDNVPGRQLALGSHPNPFNPLTRVAFSLAADGFVSLDVYDMQGRLVRRLVSEERAAGPHSVVWDGLDGDGRRVGSGVYVARLAADGQSAEHKMVLLK
jgi:hypothetical protein